MCRHITHVIHESSGGYVDIGIAEQLWQDCHAHLFGHHQQTVHLLIEGGWACYVVAQVQHHAHTVVGGGGASETVERLESGGHIAAIDAAYGVAIHPSVSLPSRPSALLVLIAIHEGREMVCRHILLFQRFAGYPVDMIGCHLCGEGAVVQHEDGLMVMAHEGIQESFGGIMGHTYGISQTPVSMMLMHENATVVTCHTKTLNPAEIASKADILVAAAGRIHSVGVEYTNPKQVIIDVGINWDEEKGGITGDVDFQTVEPEVKAITPVPGGVGTVTTSVLVSHVVEAAKRAAGK